MIIKTDTNLRNFNAWGRAVEIKNLILDEGLEEEFEEIINEWYPNGLSAAELNDLLWIDRDWVLEILGIEEL